MPYYMRHSRAVPHYLCADVSSECFSDCTPYYIHHRSKATHQCVCADVWSDESSERIPFYIHHRSMAAPHHVCADVRSDCSSYWMPYYTTETQKTGTYEKPNKNWRNPRKKFIDRNWTITTWLLGDSIPNYQCLKITSCRWCPSPRMHFFNLPLRFPIARCNISGGIPRISSWIRFNSSSVLGRVV